MINPSSPTGHVKAIKRYEHHNEALEKTVSFGVDVFSMPLHLGGRFLKDAQTTPNPFMKFATGTAAVVAPIIVAPFSTIAGAAWLAATVPPLAIRSGVDKVRMQDRAI